MSQAALLVDRDFDLQELRMRFFEAFSSRTRPGTMSWRLRNDFLAVLKVRPFAPSGAPRLLRALLCKGFESICFVLVSGCQL